jgi:uncharacterized membrane protein
MSCWAAWQEVWWERCVLQGDALIAILAMALATYVTRAGGFWLMGFVKLSPRIEAWLRALPGAVLVALVAPAVISGGLAAVVAALATLLVALRTKNLLLAMVIGVLVVWGLRHFFSL